ncbi:hypothetical protein TanjilG_23810 [Lupinus angustifolius]|uniref:Nematode resistance protein-like HSPRO2 n=3 Tax=Lupinus angustifolius TaxID=3871 RepID=A0A4P1QVP7_LUPAN|nr:hypothetical protein TanjilG_23810 [Lupinus angustifolius]
MATSKPLKISLSNNLSLPSIQQHQPFCSSDISAASLPLCSAYDHYLRLPELRKLWTSRDFPNWNNEPVLKPALQALEITFRFMSTVFSDPRPYANRRELNRRVESLATSQIEIIAMLCEDEEHNSMTRGTAPTLNLETQQNLNQRRSYSETSLLPHLATWHKSKPAAQRILLSVECAMMRCPYTLGLGEPNLAMKPSLQYDAVCKPNELHVHAHALVSKTEESLTVHATHQIIESWIQASQKLLERINKLLDNKILEKATRDCYAVERIWKLLTEIEDMHVIMDPDDFLKIKKELNSVKGETAAFCFRSKGVVEVTNMCRELKQKVPGILEVEVDPRGGPGVMEAAMKVYVEKESGFEKVHVLQAMQAIEVAMKRFFYAYKQVLVVVMGSAEASGNRVSEGVGDSLSQIFMEPAYFPSLDAAKTFLGYYWENDSRGGLKTLNRNGTMGVVID